jgi:acyl carrier protein
MPRIKILPGAEPPTLSKNCSAHQLDLLLDTRTEVLRILDEVLSLGGRAMNFSATTPLLGAIPELDSMAVVTLITTLEERFGIVVDDDEISGDTFATVGSVTDFVAGKLAA